MSALLRDTCDSGQHEPTHACPVLSPFPAQNQAPKDLFKAQGGQHLVSCAILLALPAPLQKEHPGPAILSSNSRGAGQQQQVVTIRRSHGEGSCAPNSI